MSTTFLNIVRFPIPLEFKNSALGLRRKITVGPLTGAIYLPRENLANIDESFSGLRPPQLRDIAWALKVFNLGREERDHLHWGQYFTWNKTSPAATAVASVGHAVLSFNPNQDNGPKSLSEVAAECHKHLPLWYRRLKEWIEVVSKDDLDADHPLGAVKRPELVSTPWTFRQNGKLKYDYINPMLVLHGSTGDNALDARLWSSAIRGANRELHPPEVRILLRDARAAFLRKNYRRTVLDSATATELLIDPVLRRILLRTNNVNVVDYLLKQNWSFKWRKEMLAKLGIAVPQGLAEKLMNVRNDVIHANKTITQEQARQGLALAEQLADQLEPLRVP
jgi:hypothetical protein